MIRRLFFAVLALWIVAVGVLAVVRIYERLQP